MMSARWSAHCRQVSQARGKGHICAQQTCPQCCLALLSQRRASCCLLHKVWGRGAQLTLRLQVQPVKTAPCFMSRAVCGVYLVEPGAVHVWLLEGHSAHKVAAIIRAGLPPTSPQATSSMHKHDQSIPDDSPLPRLLHCATQEMPTSSSHSSSSSQWPAPSC